MTTQSNTVSNSDRTALFWRGGYMVLFLLVLSVMPTVYTLLAVVQFLSMLVMRETNPQIAAFGAGFAEWMRDTTRFLTGASEHRPWPFSPWTTGARD
ncbi:MAG: DUF4389 domain-containing protein [Paracoccaceae bacterium]